MRKPSPIADVVMHPVRLRIIQQVGGREITTASLRSALPDIAQATRLTVRELTVLGLVAEGLTAAAAARRLAVAEGTVHKHLQNVYRKLGVRDRLGAVLRAQQLGVLRATPAREW